MSRLSASLLMTAVVVLLLALPAQSSAAKLRDCGGGVRAAIVGCPKAKRIAAEYRKTRARSVQGYTCTSGERRGRCVLDRKLVTFPV